MRTGRQKFSRASAKSWRIPRQKIVKQPPENGPRILAVGNHGAGKSLLAQFKIVRE